MSDDRLDTTPTAQKLKELRPLLLKFHKALMEAEREDYERIHGPIKNRGEYFQLVVGHEWFSWLRPISQFIAHMDTVLMSKEPVPSERFESLLEEARSLLTDSDTSVALEQRYPTAIRLDPEIGLLRSQIDALVKA